MSTNQENPGVGRTLWDFLTGLFTNSVFYPFIVGVVIGFIGGVSKIVDIKILWGNGGIRIQNIKPNLSGEWELTHTIESSSNSKYETMKIVWKMFIKQTDNKLKGQATKIKINNEEIPQSQQSNFNITDGTIEDNKIEIFFEEGRNAGTIEWIYSSDLEILKGKFSTATGMSKGSSIAIKI